MKSKLTNPKKHRSSKAPRKMVSQADAARLLGCDQATIHRRVRDGDLRLVHTAVGPRLTLASLVPGMSPAAVEQLLAVIVIALLLAGAGMGLAGEKMSAMRPDLAGEADRGRIVGEWVGNPLRLFCKPLIINNFPIGGNVLCVPKHASAPNLRRGGGGREVGGLSEGWMHLDEQKILPLRWVRSDDRAGC